MKIGIYGGSFNPVHKGHVSVAEFAIENLELDKLVFVPAFKSPFKSKVKYISGEHRINMLELIKPEKSEVSHFEINRRSTSFTIDTVRYFKQKYPNDELYLIIGSDNVYKLNKWKQINEIVETARLVVFKRDGSFSKVNIKRYNAILMDNPLYNFSSTEFRKGNFQNIDESVMRYISSNYLYIPDIMNSMLDHKRHKHSQSVGSYAARFAKSAGVDPKKAWAAGSLHDITKSWPIAKHRDFLTRVGIDQSEISDFELHSLTGYWWIKRRYLLDDEEILNSVLYHTSLNAELSQMDKVIFAADKLCEGRRHEGIQKDRQLIIEDFDAGFKKIVTVVHEILIDMERELSEEQIEVYKRWM